MLVRVLAIIFVVNGMLVLSACGVIFNGKVSIVPNGHNPGLPSALATPLPIARGAEFVTGSSQSAPSVNGSHIISVTLGSTASGVVLRTTMGRTFYSNVQGQILSE